LLALIARQQPSAASAIWSSRPVAPWVSYRRRVLERAHSPKQSMAIFPAHQRSSTMLNALNL
jgi:hypothetical protein